MNNDIKIGNIIQRNGINLLVLDIFDNNPFVIAFDTGLETEFGKSADYRISTLKEVIYKWFKNFKFVSIYRNVNLTAMDGGKSYGKLFTHVAPLTFDEYRKYGDILIPHIKRPFWLCTPWRDAKYSYCYNAYTMCNVDSNGA